MRMSKEHFDILSEKIAVVEKNFPNAISVYISHNLTLDRYRWDCLHATHYSSDLYSYGYNDSHIDTALKKIIPNERWAP